MSAKEEDIIMIGLIEMRTRTLPSLPNEPKAKLKRIKNPKYVAFVVVTLHSPGTKHL